jgi:hypothetical protein
MNRGRRITDHLDRFVILIAVVIGIATLLYIYLA